MGFGRTGCNRKSGGKPPHSKVGHAPEGESICARLCRDPSTTCRKRRDTPVGMTVWAVPQKARHSGRDDSVGGAAKGATRSGGMTVLEFRKKRGPPVGMTVCAVPQKARHVVEG